MFVIDEEFYAAQKMSSCCSATPDSSTSSSANAQPPCELSQSQSFFKSYYSSLSPLFSALLHSSCCWLPTLLDLTSIGSASAASITRLRPVFLAITIVIILDSLRRQGLSRHNVIRIVLSALVLLLPQIHGSYQKITTVGPPKKSCH